MMRLGVQPDASTAAVTEGVPMTALRNCSAEVPSKEPMLTTARLPNADDVSSTSSTPTSDPLVTPLVCIAIDDDAFLRIAHNIFFEHALGAVSD